MCGVFGGERFCLISPARFRCSRRCTGIVCRLCDCACYFWIFCSIWASHRFAAVKVILGTFYDVQPMRYQPPYPYPTQCSPQAKKCGWFVEVFAGFVHGWLWQHVCIPLSLFVFPSISVSFRFQIFWDASNSALMTLFTRRAEKHGDIYMTTTATES